MTWLRALLTHPSHLLRYLTPSRSIDQTPVPIPIPILSPIVDLPVTDLPSIDSPDTHTPIIQTPTLDTSIVHTPILSIADTIVLNTPVSSAVTPTFGSPVLHTSSVTRELGFYTPGFQYLDSGPTFDRTPAPAVAEMIRRISSVPAEDVASTSTASARGRTYIRRKGHGCRTPPQPTRTRLRHLRP